MLKFHKGETLPPSALDRTSHEGAVALVPIFCSGMRPDYKVSSFRQYEVTGYPPHPPQEGLNHKNSLVLDVPTYVVCTIDLL